jgi:hypothetical protein
MLMFVKCGKLPFVFAGKSKFFRKDEGQKRLSPEWIAAK